VFGLSLYTQEQDLREVFEHYGPIEDLQIVYDHQSGRSRGFAFIYMRNREDAVEVLTCCLLCVTTAMLVISVAFELYFLFVSFICVPCQAKEMAPGTEIDGRKIRVDYSITQRAHTPTPGVYLGRPAEWVHSALIYATLLLLLLVLLFIYYFLTLGSNAKGGKN